MRAEFKLHKISSVIVNLSPDQISSLLRILSGHNNLNYHLAKIPLSYTEYCEYCTDYNDKNYDLNSDPETAYHILCECDYFSKLRGEIFHKHHITPAEAFKNKSIERNIMRILKFFKKSKVLQRKPKLSKRETSPNRIIKKRKRKTKEEKNEEREEKRRKVENLPKIHEFYRQIKVRNLKYSKRLEKYEYNKLRSRLERFRYKSKIKAI